MDVCTIADIDLVLCFVFYVTINIAYILDSASAAVISCSCYFPGMIFNFYHFEASGGARSNHFVSINCFFFL